MNSAAATETRSLDLSPRARRASHAPSGSTRGCSRLQSWSCPTRGHLHSPTIKVPIIHPRLNLSARPDVVRICPVSPTASSPIPVLPCPSPAMGRRRSNARSTSEDCARRWLQVPRRRSPRDPSTTSLGEWGHDRRVSSSLLNCRGNRPLFYLPADQAATTKVWPISGRRTVSSSRLPAVGGRLDLICIS